MQSLQAPVSLDLKLANGAMPLYNLVFNLLSGKDFWQVFIAFCLVLINSFFIAQLGSSLLFVRNRSYLPGIIYLITVSSLQALHSLVPVHIATLCVLISIYFILSTYHKPVEITFTFNASFFLSLGSLFYLPALVLFPLVWISIFVLQKSDNWRLMVIPILGFGTPWMFLWAFSFLNDTDTTLWKDILKMLWTDHNAYLLEPYFLLLTGVVAFLAMFGSFSVLAVYHRMKVSSRKYFVIFYWMLGLLFASALGLMTIGVEIVALATIPVAYFISHFLLSDNRPIWKEILTWIYLATMVFALFFYK
ncbi:MAG TPA: DUF6427 family protein [Prolixibacteraceae bacterium]|jgi:hypothetical protein